MCCDSLAVSSPTATRINYDSCTPTTPPWPSPQTCATFFNWNTSAGEPHRGPFRRVGANSRPQANSLDRFENSSVSLAPGQNFNVKSTGLVDIDSARISVRGGLQFGATQIAATAFRNTSFNSGTQFSADGAGSLLDLSSLLTYADSPNANAANATRVVSATNNGVIDLSNVGAVTKSNNGTVRFQVASGGTILVDSLTTISGSIQFSVGNGSTFTANALTDFVGGAVLFDGNNPGTFQADALNRFENSTVSLSPGQNFNVIATGLVDIDSARISVRGGRHFGSTEIAATSFTNAMGVGTQFSADGDGSLLDLSSLLSYRETISNVNTRIVSATNNGVVDLSNVAAITKTGNGAVRFQANSGGRLMFGNFNATGAILFAADGSDSVLDVAGSVSLRSPSTLTLTNAAQITVGADFLFNYTNEAAWNLNAGIMAVEGPNRHVLEVGGQDLGVSGATSGNFGIGQLAIGTESEPTLAILADAIDNGNRIGGRDALYLFGLGGPDGLRLLGGSTLVIGNIDTYAFLDGEMVHLNSLFGPEMTAIPFDAGFLVRDILPGDYDDDGDVDGGDFLVWQRLYGSNNPAADGDGNGVVGRGDLYVWQAYLGESVASPLATVSVPEPTTFILALILLVSSGMRRRAKMPVSQSIPGMKAMPMPRCKHRSMRRALSGKLALMGVLFAIPLSAFAEERYVVWQGEAPPALGVPSAQWFFDPDSWVGGIYPGNSALPPGVHVDTAVYQFHSTVTPSDDTWIVQLGTAGPHLPASHAAAQVYPGNWVFKFEQPGAPGGPPIPIGSYTLTGEGVGDSFLVGASPGDTNLTIEGPGTGGLTTSGSTIGFGIGTNATVTLLDATWREHERLVIGGFGIGNFYIEGRSTLDAAWSTIADRVGSTGESIVSGSGASWSSDLLEVGLAGNGALAVENGASVSTRSITIGDRLSGRGAATVSGSGSTLTTDGYLSIGFWGQGALTIENGGTVASWVGGLGEDRIGVGTATITGAGSTWENGASLSVGRAGRGNLRIENGGRLIDSTFVNIGEQSTGIGEAIVTGANSRWNLRYEMIVGRRGQGTLRIEDGGVVENGPGSLQTGGGVGLLGLEATGQGVVTVSGAGSKWINLGAVYVGGSSSGGAGPGIVTVENGGAVVIDGDAAMTIWSTGKLTGGGGTVEGNVINHGVVAPGNSPGTLTIDGSYGQSTTGVLSIELASTFNFDRLLVGGHVTLGGALEVSVLDGFTPRMGDAFDILDWGTASGAFSRIQLPPLPDDRIWNISQLYVEGVLSVGAGPPIPGDFDGNRIVDGADLSFWRGHFGATGGAPPSDSDADQDVDGADFLAWQRKLGSTATAAANSAVPEPSAFLLIAGTVVAASFQRRLFAGVQ